MKKNILILGSTGSVGCSALNVISQHLDLFHVKTLIAHSNIAKLLKQVREYHPENIGLYDESLYKDLKSHLVSYKNINIVAGSDAINDLLKMQYDVTIAAISGMACLKPVMTVMPYTKILGLANKESIVCAGSILTNYAKECGTHIVPVDSEHSAIFQLIDYDNIKSIEKITLTASGGPFLKISFDDMKKINIKDAISHPVWNMGAKISIDSATMMNKGLELIEAHYLFNIEPNKLDAIIHPQAIVHGFIEYQDGSMLAQMAMPSMMIPISLALHYPKRLPLNVQKLNWSHMSSLEFYEVDIDKFQCLKIAKNALDEGQSRCIQLNAVNEVIVQAFLEAKISFLDIPKIINKVLEKLETNHINNIDDVIATAEHASSVAYQLL